MRILLSIMAAVCVLLAACDHTSPHMQPSGSTAGGNNGGGSGNGSGNGSGGGGTTPQPRVIAARAMDVDIPSPVGNDSNTPGPTLVRATVFIPEHLEGETYPLLLNSHGWGGDRTSLADVEAHDPGTADSGENYFVLVERETEAFWNAGYAVISYDERGFGRGDDGDDGTPGGAHGMSPDFEVKDASAIVDWALENLDLTLEASGDPLLGSFGGSYGGAFQLMLAASDNRIDAIVPSATWFDFELAMLPNGVIRKAYGHGLCLFAVADMAELAAETQTACNEGSTTLSNREAADASAAGRAVFENNSLKAMASAPGFVMPPVDALLFQGNRDILFNLSQAVLNYEFLTAAGGDVRLLSHEDGHAIDLIRNGPGSQGPMGEAFCGDIDVIKTMLGWFDEKLRGMPASNLPRVCISLDDFNAVHLDAIPRGDPNYRVTIPAATQATGAANHNNDTVADEALFITLGNTISTSGLVLAGLPVANITINAGLTNVDPTPVTGPDAAAFIGIGIKRNGVLMLVDDQVEPLRALDSRTSATPTAINLIAVGEALEVGDEVGVLIFGRHDQFENHTATPAATGTNWTGNVVTVEGTVDLPIIAATLHSRTPTSTGPELCVANNCGTKTTVGMVGDAENMVYNSDGRLFVSGGEQVYEVNSDNNGGFDLTTIAAANCNFTGLEIIGTTLYANCFDGGGTLWAGTIGSSVTLNQIYSYASASAPNGMQQGPDGALYTVNGPVLTNTTPRIVRLAVDPNDPTNITAQTDWFTDTFSPNGLTRIDNDFYITETDPQGNGLVRKIPINTNGSAGTASNILSVPASILDGVRAFGSNRLLVANYSGGSILLLDTLGNVVSQTAAGGFDSPTSALVGRTPLFDDTVLLVTEKGQLGSPNAGTGNVLSRFDP